MGDFGCCGGDGAPASVAFGVRGVLRIQDGLAFGVDIDPGAGVDLFGREPGQ